MSIRNSIPYSRRWNSGDLVNDRILPTEWIPLPTGGILYRVHFFKAVASAPGPCSLSSMGPKKRR